MREARRVPVGHRIGGVGRDGARVMPGPRAASGCWRGWRWSPSSRSCSMEPLVLRVRPGRQGAARLLAERPAEHARPASRSRRHSRRTRWPRTRCRPRRTSRSSRATRRSPTRSSPAGGSRRRRPAGPGRHPGARHPVLPPRAGRAPGGGHAPSGGLLRVPDGPPRPWRLRGRRRPVRRRQRGVPRRPRRLGLGPAPRASRPERIGIAGFSFGSISAIVAGGQEPGVAAVWADSSDHEDGRGRSASSSPTSSRTRRACRRSWSRAPIVWAKLIANDDLTKYDPIDEVAELRRPAHRLRPRGAGRRSCHRRWPSSSTTRPSAAGAATPDAWIVPGAGHTAGHLLRPRRGTSSA